MDYVKIAYIVLILLVRTSTTETVLSLCEGESQQIECPKGKTMSILKVFYGRSDQHTCMYERDLGFRPSNCVVATAESTVKRLCDGRQSCSFQASHNLFGDNDCEGTLKTLVLEYRCVRGINSHIATNQQGVQRCRKVSRAGIELRASVPGELVTVPCPRNPDLTMTWQCGVNPMIWFLRSDLDNCSYVGVSGVNLQEETMDGREGTSKDDNTFNLDIFGDDDDLFDIRIESPDVFKVSRDLNSNMAVNKREDNGEEGDEASGEDGEDEKEYEDNDEKEDEKNEKDEKEEEEDEEVEEKEKEKKKEEEEKDEKEQYSEEDVVKNEEGSEGNETSHKNKSIEIIGENENDEKEEKEDVEEGKKDEQSEKINEQDEKENEILNTIGKKNEEEEIKNDENGDEEKKAKENEENYENYEENNVEINEENEENKENDQIIKEEIKNDDDKINFEMKNLNGSVDEMMNSTQTPSRRQRSLKHSKQPDSAKETTQAPTSTNSSESMIKWPLIEVLVLATCMPFVVILMAVLLGYHLKYKRIPNDDESVLFGKKMFI